MSLKILNGIVKLGRVVRGRVVRNAKKIKSGGTRHMRELTLSKIWVVLLLSSYAGLAAAQVVNDTSGPWDSALCGIAGWFKGPTMLAIGTIAFGAAGAGFVFGEEMTGILKKVVNITMGVSLAVGGSAVLGWIAVKAGAGAASCT